MMGWTERFLIEAIYRHTEKELRSDESKTEEMVMNALHTLYRIKKRVAGYGEECFAFVLLAGIMLKKSQMIQNAETRTELKEILEPSVPEWNYGTFRTGPYHVAEEEAIFWSKASVAARLNEDGIKRYAEVFSQFFPEEAAGIWGTNATH